MYSYDTTHPVNLTSSEIDEILDIFEERLPQIGYSITWGNEYNNQEARELYEGLIKKLHEAKKLQ